MNFRVSPRPFVAAAAAVLWVSFGGVGDARPSFNGEWLVQALPNPGICAERYSVHIRVAAGTVTYIALFVPVRVGTITKGGRLTLALGLVQGSGRIAGVSGGGRWRSPTCSGTWTARRA